MDTFGERTEKVCHKFMGRWQQEHLLESHARFKLQADYYYYRMYDPT
jgi:hypothetical protein